MTAAADKWRRYAACVDASISGGGKKTPAQVFVQTWSPYQRKVRAIKSAGICWAVALASIGVPFVHFITVPVLFLAGLIAPFVVLKRESLVLGGSGTCPFCSKTFDVTGCADHWPLQDFCPECKQHVRIEKTVSNGS